MIQIPDITQNAGLKGQLLGCECLSILVCWYGFGQLTCNIKQTLEWKVKETQHAITAAAYSSDILRRPQKVAKNFPLCFDITNQGLFS